MNFLTQNSNRILIPFCFLLLCSTIITAQNNPITITTPAPITVECNAIPSILTPKAVTTCSGGVIKFTFSEVKTNGICVDNYTLSRTWKATDNCNNTATVIQTITVSDTKAPLISSTPANITVECSRIPIALQPTASDNCAKTPTITSTELVEKGLCADSYRIIRQWVASDNCANKSTKTQIISVIDNTKPIFSTTPKDTTVECNVVPAVITLITSDNCDKQVEVSFKETKSSSSINSGACSYILKREWTASDNCGNSKVATQLITIKDSKAPKFTTIVANITVSCSQIPPLTNPGVVDNCSKDVKTTVKETITNGSCPDAYSLKREWIATDDCGNSTVLTQLIIVQDKIAPSLFGIPSNITMSCSQVIPASSKSVTSLDNCDKLVDITFKETKVNGICIDNYIIKREWTATDNCNNQVTRTQALTIRDNNTPNFTTVPQNLTVECSKIPNLTLNAVDNCDKQVDITFKEIKTDGSCANNYILNRAWTATDNCNNRKTITQTVLVQDHTAPKLVGVPSDLTLGCKDVEPALPAVTATDNCATQVEVIKDERIKIEGCTKIITRIWSATDACGNSASATQTVTFEDKEPPYLLATLPAAITVACGAEIPVAPALMFKDKCTESVTVSYAEEIENSNNPDCPKSKIIRRWTAKDTCGNATVVTQTVFIGTQVGGNKEIQNSNTPIIASNNAIASNPIAQNELAYPNPTDGVLFVNVVAKTDEIRLSDELGRVIYKKENLASGTFNIDLSLYENGVYLLQTKIGNTQTTQRIVLLKH
jgi:large repetitive protein